MAEVRKFLQCLGGKPVFLILFLVCALPVTVLTALITPPGQSPDEPSHMARAAGLLHGEILAHRITDIDPNTNLPQRETGVQADTGLGFAAFGNETQINGHPVMTAADLQMMLTTPPNHALMFFGIPNTATYFPLAYLPATAGLAVAEAFGARPYVCVPVARMFMALSFVVLGLLTLYVAAYGEALLLTVLLMPMTLFLAGTLNQDGMLVALTCLACALLTRGTRPTRWGALAVFVCVLGSKQPYILLLGVFLEPLFTAGWVTRLKEVVIAALPVVLWVVLIALFVVVPFGKPPYHPGPLYLGDRTITLDHTDTSANLHSLLAQPSRFITLPWHTNAMFGAYKLPEMIGQLGLLQIAMAPVVYVLWGVAIMCALLGVLLGGRRPGALVLRARDGLFTLLLIFLTYWLLNLVFYLDWSNVGLDWIDGIQGRYLLPLLPFLLFALPGLRLRVRLPAWVAALPTMGLGLFGIGYIPLLLVWTYYLH